MMKVNVKHYFVIAQIVTKDGRLTERYKCYDCFSRQQAESKMAEVQGKKGFLRFEIIEYTAKQKPIKLLINGEWIESFNSIYSIPQIVKEEYQRRIKFRGKC